MVLVAVLLALVLFAVAVKLFFFPSAKDVWFDMGQGSLQQVPAGLVIIRPTHFSQSVYRRGVTDASDRQNRRVMGRDVSLRDIIAVAYGETPARVVLPPDAPTNNFDFIVTAIDSRQRLMKAIHSRFGYTAQNETRDTDVLALKIENAGLPGLAVSSPGEKRKGFYKHGNFYLMHFQLKELLRDFEQTLDTPIVDETGLTNYYDFSFPWDIQTIGQLNNETTARPVLDKILATWGLGFEPETASLEMLVVKKD